jgi:NTP pyrophosphatase (non-canonical NTP hydrolase)
MSSIKELQEEISAWVDTVNPGRTPISTISKLLEEIGELLGSDKMRDELELADIFILALDLGTIQGINIEEAIRKKLAINKSRSWRIADNGAMRHTNDD